MERFSVRNGFQNLNVDSEWRTATKMRIWQVFAKHAVLNKNSNKYDIVEDLLSYFGQSYEYSQSPFDHRENVQLLKNYISSKAKWFEVADFIEYSIANIDNQAEALEIDYNRVLDDEATEHHIIAGVVTPLSNQAEIVTVEEAYVNSPQHIAESIKKALKLYSNFEKPDYNNAVKEMITAVEALCCTIVEGEEDTLGAAVNKLSVHGIELNEFLKEAIKKLYKYTCSEEGIRHGGTEIKDVPIEDARFMIVICSAIINYLVAKWGKTV